MSEYLYKNLTQKIIRCFYNVYDELGYGFLESVYENALMIEFKKNDLKAENQKEIRVFYDNEVVGEYRVDIIVEDRVMIEAKAVSRLNKAHEVQLVNYLKATGMRVGLLVNFGQKLEFKRKIF
ncbi:GxxExxY protein [Selenihalanaerobacter shriftii]|uniref:GxxExxY protein n=1 Tax=Selenihalanaerobacter shriftii TaxID=142842 RepID=A0A1T4R989_9FIRM|nr:GxxExxY protein [Selenihalanaerobacter shriftii]SKA12640.1 GxxExxY protein [Selenihalanaerobacter shriftii]